MSAAIFLETRSFLRGMFYGALFCAIVSILCRLTFDLQSSHQDLHHHHHVKALSQDELNSLSKDKLLQLSQKVRIYCIIMVQPKDKTQWTSSMNSWIKHCDHAQFYTPESVKNFEAIELKEKTLWARLRKALKHTHDNSRGMLWFLLVRPHVFAVIENLKYLVLAKDPSEPFYIGHVMKSGDLDYVEYEAGVVLSYEALRRLVMAFSDENRCPEHWSTVWKPNEGQQLAICLRNTGVFAENGEDSEGKQLFHSKSIHTIMYDTRMNNPSNVMEGCCSDVAITFSGMSSSQMQFLMYGVYRLRPYGHDFHDTLEFLPPKGSDND